MSKPEQQPLLLSKLHWAMKVRKALLVRGSWKWNALVSDTTAWLERF